MNTRKFANYFNFDVSTEVGRRFRIVAFATFALALTSAYAAPVSTLSSAEKRQYESFREDTIDGLEKMRAPSGLINDESFVSGCHSAVMKNKTTPTNIGVDIINQLDLLNDPKHRAMAIKNLTQTMRALDQMQQSTDKALEKSKLKGSGLFFSMYSTENGFEPSNRDVSSVDNIHLALALWSAQKAGGKDFKNSEFSKLAAKVFNRMNFTPFTTPDGMMGGNFSAEKDWALDAYRYDYLGSEARSIYAVTKSIGLLKPMPDGSEPGPVGVPRYHEVAATGGLKIMKTWDGGAFQLYLPQMLIGEDGYSPQNSILKTSFDNYAIHAIDVAKENGYDLPATFSASDRGVGRTPESHEKTYEGKAGSKELAASANEEVRRSAVADDTVTLHGVFMAATRDAKQFSPILKKARELHSLSKPEVPLYCKGLGFMDGYRVKGAEAHEVVSTQFSLDQGMSLLALDRILSKDGHTASSRALSQDAGASASLKTFYRQVDNELNDGDFFPGSVIRYSPTKTSR